MTPSIKANIDECNSQNEHTYYLEEGNYVTGYYATLVHVLSGLVKAVYVLGEFKKKEFEILSKNCEMESIPLFHVTSRSNDFKDVRVLAVVEKSKIEG